jgi:hypothetical protein
MNPEVLKAFLKTYIHDIEHEKTVFYMDRKQFNLLTVSFDFELNATHYISKTEKWMFSIFHDQQFVTVSYEDIKRYFIRFFNSISDAQIEQTIKDVILAPCLCKIIKLSLSSGKDMFFLDDLK